MSPAELLRFEHNFSDAGKAALLAVGITPARSFEELGDLPANRVVAEPSAFTRASGHMAFAANRQPFYDHFTGTLTFIVTTKRDETGPALHREWLGKIRALMTRPRQAFKGLPYKIIKLEDGAGSITNVNDGERDRSELVYTIELGIPGALMDYAQA
jgi:hypothetical protein